MNQMFIFLAFIYIHFIGDFVLQSDWMALNKSKSNVALSVHVLVYSFTLLVGTSLLLGDLSAFHWLSLSGISIPLERALAFVFVNGMLHFAADFVTSRMTTWLWARERRHEFFVVIGLDQVLHYTALAATLWYMILKV